MAKRELPPPPWRHPHPVTRIAGTITLVVLAVLAIAVLALVAKGLVHLFGWIWNAV